MRCELGILGQLLPDLLDQLAGLFQVGVVGDADGQLVDDPVAAHVLYCAQFAEGHRVQRPAMMPELHRAQTEGFDDAFVAAALDVLADPEGIVEQVARSEENTSELQSLMRTAY